MQLKYGVMLVSVAVITGAIGYLIGSTARTQTEPIQPTIISSPVVETTLQPVAPADGTEFVESDMTLEWTEQPLAENQRYVLRVRVGDLPYREIWTVDNAINVTEAIDSFSVDVGTYQWQVAVVNTNADGGFESMAQDWTAPSTLERVRRLSLEPLSYDEMSPAAQYFHDMNLSASGTIDTVHRFIQTNSILEEQRYYGADYSDAIDLMFNYSQGVSDEQPYLQCDGRSTAMLTTLKELGIESRLVFLYRPVPGYLSQHTTLEVFNPDTQRWQVHDLNWDFYYTDSQTGQRVSAERILFGERETLLGCPMEGGECSYDVAEESASYFNALRYGYTFEMWVNPDRFELSTRFEGQDNRNLAEFVGGGDPERVTFRLDNWAVDGS